MLAAFVELPGDRIKTPLTVSGPGGPASRRCVRLARPVRHDMLPRMTLEQLRIFVAVAERQHVTRAAEALNLTQSAVSGALAALEAQHDVRLMDRVGRGVVLIALGEAFLFEARGVLSRAAAAEAALADMAGLRRGRLAIHATPTIANYW